MLEGLHVLGGPLAGFHACLVACAAFADKLNVGVRLDDLTLNVTQGRLRPDQVVVQTGALSAEREQLTKLGQVCLAVCDLVQARVQRLQIQQTPLTACVGFQDEPPVMSLVSAPITKSHGSVRSVQI